MSTQPLSQTPDIHHLGRKPVSLDAEIVSQNEAIVSRPPQFAIQREPEEVLAEAAKAAKALKALIDAKEKKVVINGKTFLQYEDWLTVARFYGISVAARATNYVERGRAQGYECHAEAILISSGQVIGAAQAECLDDEERWNTRPVYEWRNGQRVRVGEEKVPLFQLRSMAQTRAESKVLASILRWVVVLAGYSGTPAEEMDSAATSRPSTIAPRRDTPMNPDRVRKLCFAIANSCTIEELRGQYLSAGNEAKKFNDRAALDAFIQAKDSRKRELA